MGLRKLPVIACVVWISAQLFTPAAAQVSPDFTFNFGPAPDNVERFENVRGGSFRPGVACNMPGLENEQCGQDLTAPPGSVNSQVQWANNGNFGDDFETPFLQELITIDGRNYFHLVIGQPEDGFAVEYYIRQASGVGVVNGSYRQYSDSAGNYNWQNGNGMDPLRDDAQFTGNGTANPNAVIMRQVMNDSAANFSQEFFKGEFTQKPIISQTMDDGLVASNFRLDMSNSDYSTTDSSGQLTNTLQIDEVIPGNGGNFDFADNTSEGANVTGGRYRWEVQAGPSPRVGQYVYFDDTIDPVLTIPWEFFRDPTQNP